MQQVEQLVSNPGQALLTVLVFLLAGKYLFELATWYKERFKAKHSELSSDESFHNKVTEISCVSKEHTESLKKINESLDSINKRLEGMERDRDAEFVVNARASLYHLYEVFRDKPSLTVEQYETFDSLAQKYLDKDGNGAFRNFIIPEIRKKEIREG